MKRILIASIINEKTDVESLANGLKKLSYKNKSILFVSTSKEKKVVESSRKLGVNCDSATGRVQAYVYIKTIAKDYDYVLFVGDTIIPEMQTIERLLEHKKEVVSGISLNDNNNLDVYIIDNDQFLEMDAGLMDIDFIDGKLKQIYATGLSCTLIKVSLLKSLYFKENSNFSAEVFFNVDLKAMQQRQYLDTSLIPDFLIK
jgi:hypothetical protein